MKNENNFTLIITDYKSIEDTMSFISRFERSTDFCRVNFLIVDNSSENLCIRYLLNNNIKINRLQNINEKVYCFHIHGLDIYLVDAESNGGYSKGNNLGAKVASMIFPQTQYFIFSNNDLYFKNRLDLDEIEFLFNSDKNIGIIGPNIVSPDGKRQSPRKNQSFFLQLFVREWNLYLLRSKLFNLITDVDIKINYGYCDWVSGCFMLVRKDAFYSCGGFDENIFLYCEEMILSDKFREKGYQTYFTSKFRLVHQHKGGTSMNGLNENFKSRIYYFYHYRQVSRFTCNLAKLNRRIVKNMYKIMKNHFIH